MFSRLPFRFTAAITATAFLVGCAVDPNPSFRDVQGRVSSRTGKGTRWIRDGADAAAAHDATRRLLARRLTADSAAQIAVLNNRRLQAAFEELGIAQADFVQAGLLTNPQFSGLARFPNVSPSGTDIELSVAQDLLELLLRPVKRRIAAADLESAKLEAARAVLELVTDTKTAFYNLQARQQMLARLRLIVTVNESAADLSKRQHDAGNITDLELADEQALYSQSRVDVAQTEAQVRQDRERLNRLMGVWGADTDWKIGDKLPEIPKGEMSLVRLESKALQQRFDVAMARQNVLAIGLARGLRASTRYVPGGINVGVSSERDTDGQRVTGPTLDLQLPIFDQGQAALAKVDAQFRRAQDELEATAVEARSEVREARDLLTANRELARYYGKVLLPQRLQVVNETQLQYNAMQIRPQDLLLAKERELSVERSYIEAWRDYWIARTELEMALKGGSPRGMAGESGAGTGRAASQNNQSQPRPAAAQ